MKALMSKHGNMPLMSQTKLDRICKRPLTGGLAARGPIFDTDPEHLEDHLAAITGKALQTRADSQGVPASSRVTPFNKSGRTRNTNITSQPRVSRSLPLTPIPSNKNDTKCETQTKSATGWFGIKLEIKDMDMATPQGESWYRAYQRKILKLYTIVLRDKQTLVNKLNAQCNERHLKGVIFTDISLGSIILHTTITHANELAHFSELVNHGKLTDFINDVIVTPAVLAELELTGLRLLAHVHRDAIAQSKREVQTLSKDNLHDTEFDGNDETREQDFVQKQSVPTVQSNLDNDTSLSYVREASGVTITNIRQRYSTFHEHIDDFLMTLKLIKPITMESFRCLSDIIDCYEFLQERDVIGNNVRTDLVREYIAIVNILRLNLEDTKNGLLNLKGYYAKDSCSASLQKAIDACTNLKCCFDPSFQFANIDNQAESTLNVMNRQLFHDLVSYIPWLIDKMNILNLSFLSLNNNITTA